VARWDLQQPDTGKLLARIDNRVFSLCLLEDHDTLVIGNMDGGMHWVKLSDPEKNRNVAHHQKGVFDLALHSDSLFSAGGDGLLSRWDIHSGRARESLQLSAQALRCLALHPHGQLLAVGSSDHQIYLLDPDRLEVKRTIPQAHAHSVFSLCYSLDGRLLLSGGRDAHVKVWDLQQDGALRCSLPAHLFTINSIAFHPGGRIFATGSRDKTVKIWKTEDFSLLKVLEGARDGGHFNSVNKVCWTAQGDRLVSAGDDRTLIIWRLDSD
jgi:WD40 repeat protein